MADNDGCEREGKVVCQSGSSACLFVGSGRIIAAEFTKQRKGSPQMELYERLSANQGLLLRVP